MKFSDPVDIAAHCARAAIGMMDRHGVPPHPNNFAVWYAFVADRNPELTATINGVLRAGQKFSDTVNADLYDRFFGSDKQEAELRMTSQRIEDAVSRVLTFLSVANQGAANYGTALETISGELDRTPTSDELSTLVSTVLVETRQMIEINQQLETRLASSSDEVARLREDLDQLKREATTDALTGLANRKLFDISLREAALEAEDRRAALSLLMIDIDHFKLFNDTHGHLLGDQVLKLVSKIISDCTKGRDTAARYGGEEFSVVVPEANIKEACVLAETIRTVVADRKLLNRRTGQVIGQVTLSVGVAQYEFGESLGAFLHRADEALYLAKRQGRNRVMTERDLTSSNQIEFEM